MIERTLSFGYGNGLIGTLCLPESHSGAAAATAGIVLFNAGIIHRIGPQRLNVRAGRVLAKLGIPSIRFDLGGLGDSARGSGTAGFEEQAVGDIQAAMTVLGEATGLENFGLFGFCSGAFHSYNTALADHRVGGIMLYDAYRYQTFKSNLIRVSTRVRRYGAPQTAVHYVKRALWSVLGKLRAPGDGTSNIKEAGIAFIVDSTTKESFAKGVHRLLERGVTVSAAYGSSAIYNYPDQFKDAFKGLGIADRVSTAFLPDMDHMAIGESAQSTFIEHIVKWAAEVSAIAPSRNALPQRAVERRPVKHGSAIELDVYGKEQTT